MGTPELSAKRAFWTSDEIAERLGIDLDTVYSLAAIGGLPHLRVGRAYRFPIARVLEWEQLQLIVNDGAKTPKPTVRRQKSTKPAAAFAPQPYTGPLSKKAA